jgi:hypothetical protein
MPSPLPLSQRERGQISQNACKKPTSGQYIWRGICYWRSAMQISNVTSGYTDPATIGKRSDPIETLGAQILKAVDPRTVVGLISKSAAGAIISRYDVTSITPNEFTEMIQKLRQAGAVSDGEFQELSSIRTDLESAGVKPDETVNLVEFYSRKVSDLKQKIEFDNRGDDRQLLGLTLKRQDWAQKFALMQANPGAGVDAMA